MNIGIDVDGVLTDLASYQLKCGKKHFVNDLNMPLKNPKGYDVCEIYGCSKDEREQFWTKYIWSYCLREPMTAGATNTVKKLKQNGHKIYIITGRAHTSEKGFIGVLFRGMLRYWLKKNQFLYDEILFCSENDSAAEKSKICQAYGIDIMVDDKVENLLALKDQLRVVCFPAVWNEDCRELDEFRVPDFSALVVLCT